MTLAWKPASVSGLAVGSTIKLSVQGVGHDDGVQAISVQTAELVPHSGHVTISHRADVAAVESSNLQFQPLDDPLTLECVLGVAVVLGGVDRSQLSEDILRRLRLLTEESQPGASERFEGLTDSQRYALHLAADELGLEHRSEGRKDSDRRKLVLTASKRWKKPTEGLSAADVEKVIIKDPRKFAALFGSVPGLRLHGRAGPRSITWEPGIEVPAKLAQLTAGRAERVAVILRGFPGSGKSSLAAQLRQQGQACLVSADDSFMGMGNIQEAHAECRRKFLEAVASGLPVVVDNTNIRKADYAFYSSKAESEGYSVVVIEFVCNSTAELERLRQRSRHSVPGDKVGAMWARWELDTAALRVEPYLPQEVLPWLREQGMLGRPPKTHLVMPSGPFFSVPARARAEFFERFQSEWGRHHISELCRPQAFKLFFDVDGLCLEQLLAALPALRQLAGGRLVVTGTSEPPAPGYHVFVPSRVVDSSEASRLRRQWIEAVPALDRHIDGQPYVNPQLRLFGSRKISKEGADIGRVHSVVGCFDAAWQEGASDWQWDDVSIHI
ncbi:unnamed protein product [Polarella glacialis]|uniref:R3H domain-containing protein n=1 Tax=Polarella glacialis TaxID=89957 RepID=A0A813FKL6_POLGL|nr:unnamed protein product [Polarella glacialis]